MQDKGLNEAFWPILELGEAEKEKNKWTHGAMRFGVALSMVGMCYALYHNVPDKGRSLPSIAVHKCHKYSPWGAAFELSLISRSFYALIFLSNFSTSHKSSLSALL
jgi:hypothetical protein